MRVLIWIPILISVMTLACSQTETPSKVVGNNPVATPPSGIDHPPVELPPKSREVKRMTIEMLRNTVDLVAGTDDKGEQIRWTFKKGQQVIDVLADNGLAKTLGKPDYINTTEEPAEPTALYLKFMDDMARDLCHKMVAADLKKTDQSNRTLIRFSALDEYQDAASINENLRYLKLRFHGERVADEDFASIAPLKTLFDAAAAAATSQPAQNGWNTVCVGLFLSPEFHLY